MGRTAAGVRGIALRSKQEVVGMVVVGDECAEDCSLLAITRNGYGKRTPLEDYRVQRRGGKGLITIKCSDRNGPLVGIRDVRPGDGLMVITRGGTLIRIALDKVSEQSRNTLGVRIIHLNQGDLVANIAKIGHDIVTHEDMPVDAEPAPEGEETPKNVPETSQDAAPEDPSAGG